MRERAAGQAGDSFPHSPGGPWFDPRGSGVTETSSGSVPAAATTAATAAATGRPAATTAAAAAGGAAGVHLDARLSLEATVEHVLHADGLGAGRGEGDAEGVRALVGRGEG